MPVRVKICGLTTPDGVVAAAKADALGFNFVPGSPRFLTPADARPLVAFARPLAVGVFQDADDSLIAQAVAAGIRVLQLHGAESPSRVAEVKARFGLPVWKAAGVRTASDVLALARDFAHADALLLDARPPQGSGIAGGHGVRFDWRILSEARPPMPWILAGGLTPETVGEAVRSTGAEFVDVASGVEEVPGVKSLARIQAFLAEARRG
ncbi:phosphoribosylanthranilate isomerase [Thermaurantiacus sp.]